MPMTATQPAPATEPHYPALKIVFAGAVGGLVYWAGLRVLGTHPFNLHWYAAIPASVLFGAVAGYLGVYWLASMDTTDASKFPRSLSFAVICGICWGPVIQGAKQDVYNVIGASNAQTVQKQADSLQQKVNSNSSTDVKQAIDTSVDSTSKAIQTLPTIHDDGVKQDIQDASLKTARTLVETAKAHPEASIQGLETLGKAAAQTKDITLVRSVSESLAEVERSNPTLAPKASQARQSVLNSAGLTSPTGMTIVAH